MPLWTNVDGAAGKPKNLTATEKEQVLGVDIAEASANKNIGVQTPGWVKYTTYTDSEGVTRHKSEVLVELSTMTSDNDALLPTTITITEQPFDVEIQEGETANFTVDYATVDGVTFTVQWQVSEDSGDTWVDIDGETGFDLQVTDGDDAYVTGNQFRAVIAGGGATAESDVATLTITEVPEEE